MKKSFVFTIYSIALSVFFILTGAFFSGTPNMPKTYYLSSVKEYDGEIENAGFTLELDRSYTVKNENGEDETKYYDIYNVYACIGKAYSYNQDGKLDINIYFKTKSSGETSYEKLKKTEVSEFYRWVKIYDGETDGKVSELSRVKITSPQMFELLEVVFTAEDGTVIKINSLVSESKETKSSAGNAFDEQNSFNPSSAYAYILSDEEVTEMKAADDLFTGGNTLGKAPLTTALNAISVLVFGRNPFAIRFFSMLSGYFALIIAYLIFKRLFGNDYISLFGSLFILFASSLFSSSVTASGALAVPFILLSYYHAIGFFAERYKFSVKWDTYKNLLLTGVCVGLSVASGASNIIYLLGVPVVWGFAIVKLNKNYKKSYETAKGLDKETVYFDYHRKVNAYAWLFPSSFIIIPVAVLLLSYAVISGSVAVDGGFIKGVIADAVKSFKISGGVTALGVFIGYGSEEVGSGYKIMNYLPYIFGLFGFILTTLTAFLQKNEKFAFLWKGMKIKYKLISAIAVSIYLPVLFGINLSVVGTAVVSFATSAYIMLALTEIEKFFSKTAYRWTLGVLTTVFAISFIGCYFGILGFNMPSGLVKALYAWQL